MVKGFFLMIDGLDGSGKGTALDALKDWALLIQKKRVLDVREYGKKHNAYPKSVSDYDVIISAEPTHISYGKSIREELINKEKKYSGKEIAEAFSKDRDELYKKIIIPALKAGKWIFQERGIVTSLVYQPLQGLSLEEIKKLKGNKQALEYAPTVLMIMKADPKVTMQRLAARKKQDNAIFENLEFQKKVAKVYASKELKSLFEKAGSEVCYLSTDPPLRIEDTKRKVIEIVEEKLLG